MKKVAGTPVLRIYTSTSALLSKWVTLDRTPPETGECVISQTDREKQRRARGTVATFGDVRQAAPDQVLETDFLK